MSKQTQIIECVPNFSEGRNMEVIKQITNEIEKYKGVKLVLRLSHQYRVLFGARKP